MIGFEPAPLTPEECDCDRQADGHGCLRCCDCEDCGYERAVRIVRGPNW